MESKVGGIYAKLLAVRDEVGVISKEETNPFFKSKYFDINGLIKHIDPILSKNKLVLLQPITDGKVKSILIDSETGESVESELELLTFNDPQKLGSCITYYRRYTLQSLLGLQAEDDDGNKASKGGSTSPKKWLNKDSQEWEAAISFLKGGGAVSAILKKYSVSKENLEILNGIK